MALTLLFVSGWSTSLLFSHLSLVTMFGWETTKLNLQKLSCGCDGLHLLALLSSEILAKTEGTTQEDSSSMWHSPRFTYTALPGKSCTWYAYICVCVCGTFMKPVISIWKTSMLQRPRMLGALCSVQVICCRYKQETGWVRNGCIKNFVRICGPRLVKNGVWVWSSWQRLVDNGEIVR